MPVQPNESEKMCPQCSHSALRGEVLYFTPPHSHNPSGYWSPKKCPTCNGRGVVDKDEAMLVTDMPDKSELVFNYKCPKCSEKCQFVCSSIYGNIHFNCLKCGVKLVWTQKIEEEK